MQNEITREEMLSLKSGWDSFDASPIPPEAVEIAERFLAYARKSLDHEITWGPSVVGGVFIGLVDDFEKDFYLEIKGKDSLVLLLSEGDWDLAIEYGKEHQKGEQACFEKIVKKIQELLS